MKHLNDYLQHLTFERGLSALTCKNYARDIALLESLVVQAGLDIDSLVSIQSAQIRRFISTLNSRGLSGKSIARALSAWRGFYAYLIHHQGFTQNPVMGLRAPKTAKSLPQALSVDQAVKFVEIAGESVQNTIRAGQFSVPVTACLYSAVFVFPGSGIKNAKIRINGSLAPLSGEHYWKK